VAVLPLGTGNDLARVLGWGGGFKNEESVSDILHQVESAHTTLLDRWDVKIYSLADKVMAKERKLLDSKVMNNYMGIGMDAGIAIKFHQLREQFPEQFSSQLQNKMWYGQLGAEAYFFPSNPELLSQITFEVDGHVLDTKSQQMEGIIITNIRSYGGGCDLWASSEIEDDLLKLANQNDNEQWQVPSTHDRLLEVVGVRDSLHMGQIQVGLADAYRLAQGRSIKIISPTSSLPLQVDGEPWPQQAPFVVEITHRKQSFMLSRSQTPQHSVLGRVGGVLEWAEAKSVITASQRLTLLRAMTKQLQSSAANLPSPYPSSDLDPLISPGEDSM